MTGAAVAVIGGGVMGASAAYHLAALGQRDVVILDRADGPGAGSTGRATGGYRAQYATAINVRLSLLAREKLRRFAEETGVDPGYAPAGYLWLAASAAELDVLRAGRAVQHAEGLVEAEEVSPAEIARINPAIRLDGVVGGAFCPTDGFIRPLRILEGYLAAAARLGVRQVWGAEVRGLRRDATGRIVEVETAQRADRRRRGGERGGAVGRVGGGAGRRGAAGRAAPPPDRHHDAVRPAAGRHADDHLGGRRVPPARARRARAAALAHARDARIARSRRASIPRGSTRSSRWRTRGCRCCAGRDDRPARVLGGTVRDVARQARHPRRGRRVPQPLPDQRLVRATG